jgi:hypothetical protein
MTNNCLARHTSRQTMTQTPRWARILNGAALRLCIERDQSNRIVQIPRGIDGMEQINVLSLFAQRQRNGPIALVHAGRRFNAHAFAHTPAQRLRKRLPLRSLTNSGTCVANDNAGHVSQIFAQSEPSYAC